mmetsp:Transcript_72832/g.161070  ORF Transcript_72832/g.161070 Transcript_72832/m.161070 type:complete len:256 (-) Transcript_72832:213-980(-)
MTEARCSPSQLGHDVEASRGSVLHNGVLEAADLLHFHNDFVARLEPGPGFWPSLGNAEGGAREDNGPGTQGRADGKEADDLTDVEDEVASIGVLHLLPVQKSLHMQIVGVRNLIRGSDHRPERGEVVKHLGPAPLAPRELGLLLPIPCGEVIGNSVAQDIVQCHLRCDVLASLANDNSELDLVVHLLRNPRLDDLGTVAGGAGHRLHEDDWILRVGQFELVSVAAIVQADAKDVAGLHRGQKTTHCGPPARVPQV